jgi:hypothetical protein
LVGFIRFMRALLTVLVAASLSATTAQAEPLAAGRPAGVRAARMSAWNEAVMLGTGAVILAAVGILASRTSSVIHSEHFDSSAVPISPANTTVTGTN